MIFRPRSPNHPRAPGFPPELATSALWLNDSGLDIRCVRLILYHSDESLFVDASQLIPLAEADDYLVRARRKAEEVESVTRQRRPPTPNVLFDHGRIKGGEEIKLYSPYFADSDDFDFDDSKWRAHFGPEPSARRNVNWNETAYSLTNSQRAPPRQAFGSVSGCRLQCVLVLVSS